MFCRAFPTQINQWVRLSPEPGRRGISSIGDQDLVLIWRRVPCMFDITETSLFFGDSGLSVNPHFHPAQRCEPAAAAEMRGRALLLLLRWCFLLLLLLLLLPPTCHTVCFCCVSLTVLQKHRLQNALDFYFLTNLVFVLEKQMFHCLLKQLNSGCNIFLKY